MLYGQATPEKGSKRRIVFLNIIRRGARISGMHGHLSSAACSFSIKVS